VSERKNSDAMLKTMCQKKGAGTMPSLMDKLKKHIKEEQAIAAMPMDQTDGYPIPTTEKEFAEDERAAIIQFDGGVQGDNAELVQMVMDVFQGRIAQAG